MERHIRFFQLQCLLFGEYRLQEIAWTLRQCIDVVTGTRIRLPAAMVGDVAATQIVQRVSAFSLVSLV